MAGTAGQALDYFRNHVLGIVERPNGSNHAPPITDRFGDGPWCAMTTDYVLRHGCGIIQGTAWCDTIIEMGRNGTRGWSWGTIGPEPGDLVLYEWGNGGFSDHVGMLEAVRSDGKLIVLEGNTSHNDARRMVRNWDRTVIGFARPPYVTAPVPQPQPEPPESEEDDVLLIRVKDEGKIFLAGLTPRPVYIEDPAVVKQLRDQGTKYVDTDGRLYDALNV